MADEIAPVVRDAAKAITGVIGWIGASLVGITALCYGAGYFVIHTHLSMLGLSDVVDVPNSQLLLEGGRFFYWTLAQVAVGWMIIVVIGTIICLVARIIYEVPTISRSKVVTSVRERLSGPSAKRIGADLLPLAAIAIIVWHYDWFYDPTNSILGLSNLLFSTGPAHDPTAAMIMSGDQTQRANLIETYDFFVWAYALVVAVTWLMVYKGGRRAFGRAANFVFITYTIVVTAFLPQAFAVLVRTPFYPVANVMLRNGQQVRGLIVQRTDRNILIWDAEGQRAQALSPGDVTGFEVTGERDIFQKERKK